MNIPGKAESQNTCFPFLLSYLCPFLRFPRSLFVFFRRIVSVFPRLACCFPGGHRAFSPTAHDVFRQRRFCFPVTLVLFSSCLFIRPASSGKAIISYTHSAAWYPIRLARGYAPLTPARPAKGSGQGKNKRRKSNEEENSPRTTAWRVEDSMAARSPSIITPCAHE